MDLVNNLQQRIVYRCFFFISHFQFVFVLISARVHLDQNLLAPYEIFIDNEFSQFSNAQRKQMHKLDSCELRHFGLDHFNILLNVRVCPLIA